MFRSALRGPWGEGGEKRPSLQASEALSQGGGVALPWLLFRVFDAVTGAGVRHIEFPVQG